MIEYIEDNAENSWNLSYYGFCGEGFYFWDETEACCYGPYSTRDEAQKSLEKYIERLNVSRREILDV